MARSGRLREWGLRSSALPDDLVGSGVAPPLALHLCAVMEHALAPYGLPCAKSLAPGQRHSLWPRVSVSLLVLLGSEFCIPGDDASVSHWIHEALLHAPVSLSLWVLMLRDPFSTALCLRAT